MTSPSKKTSFNNSTVYDVKSNSVTVEFTKNFKEAEEALAASTASPSNKGIYAITELGQRKRVA